MRRDSSRRGRRAVAGYSYGQNWNMINFEARYRAGKLGNISTTGFCILLAVGFGFFFLSQNVKVTGYDHEFAKVSEEVASLQAERDALAVENAKISAKAASASTNTVAANMANADEANYLKH